MQEKCYTNEEYLRLIPPVTASEYKMLKRSIKEEGRLLLPVVLNQDNVVLDGHHRIRACQELHLPISYTKKDFTGRPLDEMMYVVGVNLYRRHLNEFQRAEIGIRFEELRRKIAQKQQEGSRFTPETSQMAHKQRYHPETQDLRSASQDAHRSDSDDVDVSNGKTSYDMAKRVGISPRTYERVRYILKEGSEEQIEKLRRNKGSIRQTYEQLKFEKLQDRLETSVGVSTVVENDDDDDNYDTSKNEEVGIPAKIHDNEEAAHSWKKEEKNRGFNRDSSSNMHLLNKDFRLSVCELFICFETSDPLQ